MKNTLIDKLSPESLKALNTISKEQSRTGYIYKGSLDRSHNVNTQDEEYRFKIFIVIGEDADFVYGALLVNTKINPAMASSDRSFSDAHYLLLASKYNPPLKYDSWVCCNDIKAIPNSDFIDKDFECHSSLDEEDQANIKRLVKKYSSKAQVKRFNIR